MWMVDVYQQWSMNSVSSKCETHGCKELGLKSASWWLTSFKSLLWTISHTWGEIKMFFSWILLLLDRSKCKWPMGILYLACIIVMKRKRIANLLLVWVFVILPFLISLVAHILVWLIFAKLTLVCVRQWGPSSSLVRGGGQVLFIGSLCLGIGNSKRQVMAHLGNKKKAPGAN